MRRVRQPSLIGFPGGQGLRKIEASGWLASENLKNRKRNSELAELKREWKGMGLTGQDLGSEQNLMEVTDEGKKAIRLFMMQTRVDEPVWLRTMQGVVMEEMGALTPASARRYRLLMQNTFGLIKSFKEEGSTRWLVALTDRGVDFVNW